MNICIKFIHLWLCAPIMHQVLLGVFNAKLYLVYSQRDMAEILSFTRELNMSEDSVPMAKRIIQARTLLGVSQATFGEMAGLEGRTANVKMSQYETGIYQPKYNFVLKLAEVSGLPEFFFYIKDNDQATALVEAVQNNEEWIFKAK